MIKEFSSKSFSEFLNKVEKESNKTYSPEAISLAKLAWDTAMGQVLEELNSVIGYYDEKGEYVQ